MKYLFFDIECADGGKATIVIPTNSVGEVKVIVEYQENDIYNASKAVNKSAIGTPDEEVVVIDVSKIPTITIRTTSSFGMTKPFLGLVFDLKVGL